MYFQIYFFLRTILRNHLYFGKEDANVYVENNEEDEDDINDSEEIF